jgi:hypothetical protein
MTSLGDILRNLSQVIDGPDLRFDVDFPGSDGKPVRRMLIGDPMLGEVGAPWVWEYGGNVTSYTWPRDATRMVTRSFAVGEGSDVSTPIGVYEETSRYGDGWPLLEADVTYTSTDGDTTTLPAHAESDTLVNDLPVSLPVLVTNGDSDPVVGSVSPGDDGRVIISDDYFGQAPPDGTRGLDIRMRVVTLEVTAGDAVETQKLTMAPVLSA